MARTARAISKTGCYHITARGNAKIAIFDSERDRIKFKELLVQMLTRYQIVCYAWCLMENHIHLIVEDKEGNISIFMRDLLTAYSKYFNWVTQRTGHVFENRFHSVAVKSNKQLLAAIRYVHNNPRKAGICEAADYRWSSYREYLGPDFACDTQPILEILGGVEAFKRFSDARNKETYCPMFTKRASEEDVRERVEYVLGKWPGVTRTDVASLPKRKRNAIISMMRQCGLSMKQIERQTGIGQGIIQRC